MDQYAEFEEFNKILDRAVMSYAEKDEDSSVRIISRASFKGNNLSQQDAIFRQKTIQIVGKAAPGDTTYPNITRIDDKNQLSLLLDMKTPQHAHGKSYKYQNIP